MKLCMGCMEHYADSEHRCPHCGYVEGTASDNAVHMTTGTILNERYIVGKVIGYGGFGVTYIGWDAVLQTKIAIKEYLPSEFSTRVIGQTQVTVYNGDKREQFADGMKKFVEEAKKLARFHSAQGIVKIFDTFECNNTAYIIMELLEGETLAEKLEHVKKFPPQEAVKMMLPIIDSLKTVHANGIIHRDISPDNIFVTKTGDVKLIDFGAARYATTTHSRSLTVIIKPGYSPEEQYRSRGDQGPHTDVYAVAATLYKMITGVTPPDALERRAYYENRKKDMLEPLSKYVSDIPKNLETAIMNALNIMVEDRTPDMEKLREELTSDGTVEKRLGSIKKLDTLGWPLWAKITVPIVSVALVTFIVLFSTGVIKFKSKLNPDIDVPEGQTRVPSVININYQSAQERLDDSMLGITILGREYDERIEENMVLRQDTSAGSIVPKDTDIGVTVSGGIIKQLVPNTVGSEKDEAVKNLEALKFKVTVEEVYDDTVVEGCIISQSLEAESEVNQGSEIVLKISKGKDPAKENVEKDVIVPELVGADQEEAMKKAQEQGITVKIAERRFSKDYPENSVISQSVKAGETIKNTQVIELVISKGFDKRAIPNVVFEQKENAVTMLENAGFKVSILEKESETTAAGVVMEQSPAGKTEADPETTVTITVSTGKPQKAATTTTKKTTTTTTTTTAKPVYTVSFNANGGTVSENQRSVTSGSTYGTLPTPVLEGHTFGGWFTSAEGGSQVSASTKVTGSHTLYAHWTANSYTLTFNANGGTVSKKTKAVAYGEKYGTLPTPKKDYCSFVGWYTKASGGTKVKTTTVMGAGNVTVYAHWKDNDVSEWELVSNVPADAQIIERKWTYTYTETTESDQTSLSGWTQTGGYWSEVGRGYWKYGSYNSGFKTSNSLYKKYNKSALSAYENQTSKREVSGSDHYTYIYWHWTYELSGNHSEGNRCISDTPNEWISGGGSATVFEAFEDSKNYTFDSRPGVNAYKITGHSTYSYWWVKQRVDIKQQYYVDYKRIFQYQRVSTQESTTKVNEGSGISNVKEYVRYRNK